MDMDLNADMGEGFGAYRMGEDEALMSVISSANIACGYHAGDPVIMDRTVRLAKEHGVDIGAHVGFPDLMGFGRRRMHMDLAELEKHVLYQLGALHAIAVAAGQRVVNVSFHGALGNIAAVDDATAETLVRAVASFDRNLFITAGTRAATARAAEKIGLRAVSKFLADRAYDDDGQLVARKLPGAVIKDDAAVAGRVRQLLSDGTVTTITGKTLKMPARSILVHSDTPGALDLARSIRTAIEAAGGRVVPASALPG